MNTNKNQRNPRRGSGGRWESPASNSEDISETLSIALGRQALRLAQQLSHCEHRWWGWVYVVEAIGTPLVKVGWCEDENLVKRVRALQNMSPVELRLALLMVGTRADEQTYHLQMSALRRHGEWFDNTAKEVILYFMSRWHEPTTVPCRHCEAEVYGCAPPEVYGCNQRKKTKPPPHKRFEWRGRIRQTLAGDRVAIPTIPRRR